MTNIPNGTKGEAMKKHFLRMAIPAVALAAMAMSAQAQVRDQLVVNVPYQFVVGNKTLPAGEYRVSRVSTSNEKELVLSSVENRTGVLLVSDEIENARGDMPKLIFETVSGEHFLSKIQTTDHVFDVPVSQSAVLEASAKAHPGSGNSGAAGTD
jgi:hypothetical protein